MPRYKMFIYFAEIIRMFVGFKKDFKSTRRAMMSERTFWKPAHFILNNCIDTVNLYVQFLVHRVYCDDCWYACTVNFKNA